MLASICALLLRSGFREFVYASRYGPELRNQKYDEE